MPVRARLIVAPVTPMNADGELNLARVPALFQLLRARGADGFYLCGGTGEGMLLEPVERMRVVDAWADAVGRALPLVVHVGSASPRDARKLARHAGDLGVAAISSVAPPMKGAGTDMKQVVATFASIAEAAPNTPFYFYHNPGTSIAKLCGYDFLAAAERALPTLAGIKFTSEDLFDLSRCLRFAGGRYQIFYGKDEFLLGAHATGAQRFIGGSFNLLLPLVQQVLRSVAAGDLDAARAAQHQLVDVVAILRRFGGLPAVKASLAMLGVPCGPVRLPLKTISPNQEEQLFCQIRTVWPAVADVPSVSAEAPDAVAATTTTTSANGNGKHHPAAAPVAAGSA